MTTDRTAPARPAALAERPANGPRKDQPAPDVFAQILGAKAPADQPKRADAPKKDDAPKDQPAGDTAKPTDERPGVVADPAQAVTPEAPVQPAVPAELVPNPQFVAQLASPLPAPQATAPESQPAVQLPLAPPIQALAQPVVPTAQQPAAPVVTAPEAQVATAPPATEATTAPAVPTADTPLPAAPVKADDVKLPQAPVTTAPQAQPQAAQADTPAQANAGDTGKQPAQQQPEQTAAPAPTPSTAHVADAPKAEAPAEPQPVQAPAPAPAQATPALERAVPLYRAPHTAAAVIHLAQQHGVTHARINLKPAELGGIEVRLHSTPQGVAAHLVADSPEAAKALSQASDDLRRQLEARDVNLLSLDVSTSNGDDGRQAGFGADAGRDGSANGTPTRGYGLAGDEQPSEAPAETTLVLPDGVLVDVLA
jgi:flagellar hook-length control protein FliK